MKRFQVKRFSCVVAAVLIPLLLTTAVAQAQAAPWTVVASPNSGGSNFLFGAASISANDVWAVGEFGTGFPALTLTLHWNGTAWSVVTSPNAGSGNNTLNGVTAISTTDVWAVGDFQAASGRQTLTEHWNGHKWRVIKSPNAGSDNILLAVAAVSTNDVWAVGQFSTASSLFVFQTLIEHWDGTKWSVVKSPGPGTQNNVLNGVTVVATNDVWAVGDFTPASGTQQTLIEQWNGTSWSVVSSPSPSSSFNFLDAATADKSSGQAWAVGYFENASSVFQTLTEFNP